MFLAKGENIIVVYQNVAFLILKHETEHKAEMSLLETSHQGLKHIVLTKSNVQKGFYDWES